VHKVSDPLQPELAIGAVGAGNVAVWRCGAIARPRGSGRS
jgi:predicted phosphoribosyltransferase